MKLNFEKEKGLNIIAEFTGTVSDYAMMWLKLTNTARENKKVFYSVYNNDGNDVYVLIHDCNDNKKEVTDYLEKIGLRIRLMQPCTVICPIVDYETDEEYTYEFAWIHE